MRAGRIQTPGIGCSRGKGIGVNRFRSSTTPTGRRIRCPIHSCRWNCPTSKTTHPCCFDPDDADSEPSPPLNKATDWVNVVDLGDGLRTYTRDTNVMPQWAAAHGTSCDTATRRIQTSCAPRKMRPTGWARARRSTARATGRRRPLRRWCRTCRTAPVVFAVLAQGSLRPRTSIFSGTVPAPGQSGLHPGLCVYRCARFLRASRRCRRARREVLPSRSRR